MNSKYVVYLAIYKSPDTVCYTYSNIDSTKQVGLYSEYCAVVLRCCTVLLYCAVVLCCCTVLLYCAVVLCCCIVLLYCAVVVCCCAVLLYYAAKYGNDQSYGIHQFLKIYIYIYIFK